MSLPAVVSLQKVKTELVAAEERLHGIPDWMKELHEEHSQKKGEIDAVAAKGEEAAKARRESEAGLADAQEKLKHFQGQISQVSTQREYTALLKEIDTAKELIADLEKKVLESIEATEAAEKEKAELEEAFRDLDERYQGELAKWEAEKPAVAERIEALSKQEKELRGQLARPIEVLFDRIYERHGSQAVARIARVALPRSSNALWHCEACSYNVRPQVIVEIRNEGKITQCDQCKRILYLEEEGED